MVLNDSVHFCLTTVSSQVNCTVQYIFGHGSSTDESDEYLIPRRLPAPPQGTDRCESGCDRGLCAASSGAPVSGHQRGCTARKRTVFLRAGGGLAGRSMVAGLSGPATRCTDRGGAARVAWPRSRAGKNVGCHGRR